jgi:hypothetical protein
MPGRTERVISKNSQEHNEHDELTTRIGMKFLERNGDRADPWAFGWPALKIGLCALLWPDWKRYSVLPIGRTDSRLSQAFCASALPEEAIRNAMQLATRENRKMRKRN